MAESRKKDDAGDGGAAEVQATVDKLEEQGFMGQEVDPTPNENYSVDGVTSGKPTPETDAKAAAKAVEATGTRMPLAAG